MNSTAWLRALLSCMSNITHKHNAGFHFSQQYRKPHFIKPIVFSSHGAPCNADLLCGFYTCGTKDICIVLSKKPAKIFAKMCHFRPPFNEKPGFLSKHPLHAVKLLSRAGLMRESLLDSSIRLKLTSTVFHNGWNIYIFIDEASTYRKKTKLSDRFF